MGDTNKINEGQQDNGQGTGKDNNGDQGQQQQDTQKQYTQTELELLLAQKRVENKNEFLKSIGFDGDEEGLKNTLERVLKEDEKNQTELDKAQKELAKVQRELAQIKQEKQSAESKLEALKLGAKPETVDDLVILASAKLPENGKLSTVITELKKTYPVYFSEENDGSNDQGNSGTKGHINGKDVKGDKNNDGNNGSGNNGKGSGNDGSGSGEKSIAERLLANRVNKGKSNYFKNK